MSAENGIRGENPELSPHFCPLSTTASIIAVFHWNLYFCVCESLSAPQEPSPYFNFICSNPLPYCLPLLPPWMVTPRKQDKTTFSPYCHQHHIVLVVLVSGHHYIMIITPLKSWWSSSPPNFGHRPPSKLWSSPHCCHHEGVMWAWVKKKEKQVRTLASRWLSEPTHSHPALVMKI